MKISFKILLIIVILILSLCFNIKAQDNGIKNFDVNKILSEMLIINKNSSKNNKKSELPTFSTAVFPISFEAAFRAAMLVEMSLGRVPVMVDKIGGILTTSDSPLKMLSGSVFVSYYFEPLGKNKTRVYIRTKAFHFSSGISGGWNTDDKIFGPLYHLETVLLYVTAAQAKETEIQQIVKKLSNPQEVIRMLKAKYNL